MRIEEGVIGFSEKLKVVSPTETPVSAWTHVNRGDFQRSSRYWRPNLSRKLPPKFVTTTPPGTREQWGRVRVCVSHSISSTAGPLRFLVLPEDIKKLLEQIIKLCGKVSVAKVNMSPHPSP